MCLIATGPVVPPTHVVPGMRTGSRRIAADSWNQRTSCPEAFIDRAIELAKEHEYHPTVFQGMRRRPKRGRPERILRILAGEQLRVNLAVIETRLFSEPRR
jgi:hypothetical protein